MVRVGGATEGVAAGAASVVTAGAGSVVTAGAGSVVTAGAGSVGNVRGVVAAGLGVVGFAAAPTTAGDAPEFVLLTGGCPTTVTVLVTVTVGRSWTDATLEGARLGANPPTTEGGTDDKPMCSPVTLTADQVRTAASTMPRSANRVHRAPRALITMPP